MDEQTSIILALRSQNDALLSQLRSMNAEKEANEQHMQMLYAEIERYQGRESENHESLANSDDSKAGARIEPGKLEIRSVICNTMCFDIKELGRALSHLRETTGKLEESLQELKSEKCLFRAVKETTEEKTQPKEECDEIVETESELDNDLVTALKRQLDTTESACSRLVRENELLKENTRVDTEAATGKWAQLTVLQRRCDLLEKVLELSITR